MGACLRKLPTPAVGLLVAARLHVIELNGRIRALREARAAYYTAVASDEDAALEGDPFGAEIGAIETARDRLVDEATTLASVTELAGVADLVAAATTARESIALQTLSVLTDGIAASAAAAVAADGRVRSALREVTDPTAESDERDAL